MDCKKIGKYIKDKRKALGYKQSDLGEMLSVSDKAVSKWECGVALPDVSLLPELSKILNVDISEILNGEDDPKVEKEIKNKNKSKICIITLSILSSILFILVIILGIYFINNYDRVHVYKLVGEKDGFYVEGNLISIGDRNYFSINNISYNSSVNYNFNYIQYELSYQDKVLYKNTMYNSARILELNTFLNDVNIFCDFVGDGEIEKNEYFILKIKINIEEEVDIIYSIFLKVDV